MRLDCFAEPVIGSATSGRTRWLAMTQWRFYSTRAQPSGVSRSCGRKRLL
jgi:hypothetical protein